MACVSEAIGLALPGSAGAPAPYESRDDLCFQSGEAGDGAFEEEIFARAILLAEKAWKMQPQLWQQRVAQPMALCIYLQLHMNAGLNLIFLMLVKSSKHAIYCRFKTGRKICCQRFIRSWRCANRDKSIA